MTPGLTVYILGNYRPGMADGLAEFNFQNVKALKHIINFHFVEFDNSENLGFYSSEIVDEVQIHRFGSKELSQFKLSPDFKRWLKSISLLLSPTLLVYTS
jgi:hypothetical protein